jgi:ribokinase
VAPARSGSAKVAVVGHVEWCTFVRVERLPRPGTIVHARETWEEAAGGGAVAAAQLARLAGEATLFTALGGDELGRRARVQLESLDVRVHASASEEPQRRAFVFVDDAGERTITVIGAKLRPRGNSRGVPWGQLAGSDGVFFVSGDVEALHAARRARVLVATPRELPTLREGGVELDALVGSGDDEGERYRPGDIDPPPRLVVATAGRLGGWAQPGGPYRAVPPAGPFEDTYGAGDAFAAGLTHGLACGLEHAEALALAAECGAEALARRGAHGRDADR